MTNKIVVDFLRVCIRVNRYCQGQGFTIYKQHQERGKWGKDGAPGHHILKVIKHVSKVIGEADRIKDREGTLEDFILSIDNNSPHYKQLKDASQSFWDGLDTQGDTVGIDSSVIGFYRVDINGHSEGKDAPYKQGLVHCYDINREEVAEPLNAVKQKLYEIAYLETQNDPFNSFVALYAIKMMGKYPGSDKHLLKDLDINSNTQTIIDKIMSYIVANPRRALLFYNIVLSPFEITDEKLDVQEGSATVELKVVPAAVSMRPIGSFSESQHSMANVIFRIYGENEGYILAGLTALRAHVNFPQHKDHFINCINVGTTPTPVANLTTNDDANPSGNPADPKGPNQPRSKLGWIVLLAVGFGILFAGCKYFINLRRSRLALSQATQSIQSIRLK